MNVTKTATLHSWYPHLLADSDIECGDGWFDIIDELCEALVNEDGRLRISTIKQKHGELCAYVFRAGSTDDDQEFGAAAALSNAIEKSRVTCETCGQPGRLISVRGCMRTVCASH